MGNSYLYAIERGCYDADQVPQNHWLFNSSACDIQRDLEIRKRNPVRHQQETEPIPTLEKLAPPSQVQTEFLVQTNGMVITSESTQ